MELSQSQISQVMKRFPEFKLSYETISHKKVLPEYNVAMAIPLGKKAYAWFTFYQDQDVCYVLELNKDKRVCKVTRHDNLAFPQKFALGTILYGTIMPPAEEPCKGPSAMSTKTTWFILEDIYFYQGVPMKSCTMNDKFDFIENFLRAMGKQIQSVTFVMPLLWEHKYLHVDGSVDDADYPSTIPPDLFSKIAYTTHHIQYRSLNVVMPYLNVVIRKPNMLPVSKPSFGGTVTKKSLDTPIDDIYRRKIIPDFNKPQYKCPTVFQVKADIQYDIYHLFAYGKKNAQVYVDVAYVPNYKSSVFLNGLFRKIRENKNLDYIEESDDEDDFQNINEDKYVDLTKTVMMECVFLTKFKRWVPVKVVDRHKKIVHVSMIARNNTF